MSRQGRLSLGLALSGLLFCLAAGHVKAEDRFGVLFPEEQQRQSAILRAQELGQDNDFPEPFDTVPTNGAVGRTVETGDGRSLVEEKVEQALKPATLEEQIQDQRLNSELSLFGYDIFNQLPSTFAPVESLPVPPDYTVGPGDAFKIQIFSSVDLVYDLVVTREGKLLVPEIGDIIVSGLTYDETKLLLSEAISRSRLGAKVVVTLVKLHAIQVMLVGEVLQPGNYTVSGLSTLLNTLITTGGVKRTGSLRNIQLKRAGRLVAELDLYDLLLRGDTSSNVGLRQGDVIFIPPIGGVISIAGEVVRPAIYELKDEETVADVINLSGGLLATAQANRIQIERVEANGVYSLLQVDNSSGKLNSFIQNGDLIRVFAVVDKVENIVLLTGNVLTPGGVEWYSGMRVSDLLSDPRILLQSTDFSIAAIEREDSDLKRSNVLYFDIGAALDSPGSSRDPLLQSRDQVVIFDTFGNRSAVVKQIVDKLTAQTSSSVLAPVVSISGAIRHEGKYPLANGMRFLDLIRLAGGIKTGVDREYSLLVRKSEATEEIEFIALKLSVALSNRLSDHNPVLTPGDKIYLFDQLSDRPGLLAADLVTLERQARYHSQARVVEVSGSVSSPGKYPLVAGMRLADLVVAAGGLKEDAYGVGATLARKKFLDDEYSRTDQMKVTLSASDSFSLGADLILEPRDHLLIRQKPEWIDTPKRVSIEGEVKHPGDYEVDKRATLCSLISEAGGFTDEAYLFGAVFTRESVRRREQDAIDRIHRQIDDLLADVHMSPGVNKDSKLPSQQGTWDTYQVISRLKPEKAIGRMVIDLEKAAVDCDERWDLALENGDRLFIPRIQREVSVVGQVYFPQSHQYRSDRAALDYINLSGGTKELAQREHAYVVQANGEIMSVRSGASTWGWLLSAKNVKVTPGSTIYVPLSVDRINGREFTESWIDLVYKLTLSAASVDFLFGGSK